MAIILGRRGFFNYGITGVSRGKLYQIDASGILTYASLSKNIR